MHIIWRKTTLSARAISLRWKIFQDFASYSNPYYEELKRNASCMGTPLREDGIIYAYYILYVSHNIRRFLALLINIGVLDETSLGSTYSVLHIVAYSKIFKDFFSHIKCATYCVLHFFNVT